MTKKERDKYNAALDTIIMLGREFLQDKASSASQACSIAELAQIIRRARDRSLQPREERTPWLVELPMTDDEYARFNELVRRQ